MIDEEYRDIITFDTSLIEDFEERLKSWKEDRDEMGGSPESDLKIILTEEIERLTSLTELLVNKNSEDLTPQELFDIFEKLLKVKNEYFSK